MKKSPQTINHKPQTVLLGSGGLDSSLLWWICGRPTVLYCGSWNGANGDADPGEMLALHELGKIVPEFGDRVLIRPFDFRPMQRPGKWNFPRECVLAQLAWAAGFDEALFGYVADDGMTAAWVRKTTRRMQGAVGDPAFRVRFPAWNMSKIELLKAALAAGMPAEFARATRSCVRQAFGQCGECDNCRLRAQAFRKAGL